MENKSIITLANKNKNYSIISNIHLKDKNLSWDAKGLLSYLLTLHEDINIYPEELAKHTKDSVSKINIILKELLDAGYINKEILRGIK